VVSTKVTFDMNSTAYIGVGLMCGTSLDGLDVAIVKFSPKNGQWNFTVLKTDEVKLPSLLKEQLEKAQTLNGEKLSLLNIELGRFIGIEVRSILNKFQFIPDFIASHGVTVFHQPENNLTLQIGSGAEIAVQTGIKTICDFRTTDIALGGQGAPLVPFADNDLFSKYDYALNLGGFCNLSKNELSLSGFDITVCNMALNSLIKEIGHEYDANGDLATRGIAQSDMLNDLNDLDYFKKTGPKSLGKEWFENEFEAILKIYRDYSLADRLKTVCRHIGFQLGTYLNDPQKNCLVTGGGTHHKALIKEIRDHSKSQLIIPAPELINFKEAICFAYFGLMRLLERQNISVEVTGARLNSSSGAVYLPPLSNHRLSTENHQG
jgi:anhydro-N-acetylmuramic acid kinase